MSNGSTTTYFVGAHYEVANGVVTKYYYAGSQRIALRQNGTLNYILGDHLGSTSLVVDAVGVIVSETRYKAWGEVRFASGNSPTKYTFTGQYSYTVDFGLMFYNARWLDVSLGRFAQADTIIPLGIQGLDRYTYVNNAPIKYIDPSGHIVLCDDACERRLDTPSSSQSYRRPNSTYVILICGVKDGQNCARRGESGDPLSPYREWANQQPGHFFTLTYDVDQCGGTKAACLKKIIKLLDQHPSSNFYIIGHSAGADVALLAAEHMIDNGKKDNLKGLVLLDPTLTAGQITDHPEYENNGGLLTPLEKVLGAGVNTFVGDGIGAGSDEELGIQTVPYLDPRNNSNLANFSGDYSYNPYPGMNHYALSTDQVVFLTATGYINQR